MRRLLPDPIAELDDAGLVESYRLPPGRSVRVNFIASLDGATTVAGRSEGLQSPGDLRVFQLLRALADAVLVGAGTAAAESYRPTTVPLAVVSRRASLAPGDRLAVPGTLLVTCEAADPDRRAALTGTGVDVLVCGQDDVDLPLALDRLAERGLEQITCEGGPQLFRSVLAAGVVDELDLSIAPALVGDGVRLVGDAPLPDVARLELRSLLEEDGMLFARYGVRRDGRQVPGAR